MNKPFEGKIALITGGSFGIGQAAAIAFAKQGRRWLLMAGGWRSEK